MIQIKNRYTGKVIKEIETLYEANFSGANFSGANLREANFSGADFSGADLREANFSGADLYEANFSGADFSRADLRGADLRGADLRGAKRGKYTISKPPIAVNGLMWFINIWDEHMEIGCESHSFEEWKNFTDEQISEMDGRVLDFWQKYKNMLLAACETRNA